MSSHHYNEPGGLEDQSTGRQPCQEPIQGRFAWPARQLGLDRLNQYAGRIYIELLTGIGIRINIQSAPLIVQSIKIQCLTCHSKFGVGLFQRLKYFNRAKSK